MKSINSFKKLLDTYIGLLIVGAFLGIAFISINTISDRLPNLQYGGYQITISFDNIGNLVNNAPVKSAGVQVGRIDSIVFDNESKQALVYITLANTYTFSDDAIFSIVSSGLIGGQYVEVVNGISDDLLAHGAELEGTSAIILEHLISDFVLSN